MVPFKLRVFFVSDSPDCCIYSRTNCIYGFDGEGRFKKLILGYDPVILSAWHDRSFYVMILIHKRFIQKKVQSLYDAELV